MCYQPTQAMCVISFCCYHLVATLTCQYEFVAPTLTLTWSTITQTLLTLENQILNLMKVEDVMPEIKEEGEYL